MGKASPVTIVKPTETYAISGKEEYEHVLSRLLAAMPSDAESGFRGADFSNNTFELHSWCWCERSDCPQCGHGGPNFRHNPSGLELRWYKFPLNNGWSNQPITLKSFTKIISECIDSVHK